MNNLPANHSARKSSRFLKFGRIQFSREAERRLFFYLTLALLLMGVMERLWLHFL